MNDIPPSESRPDDPRPIPSARAESSEASPARAEPVSELAGWPGAVLSSAGHVENPPAAVPPPAQTPPPTTTFAPPVVPPPAPRVEEVEAVPLTRSEARGPAIRVEATPRAGGFGAGVPTGTAGAPADTKASSGATSASTSTSSNAANAASNPTSTPPPSQPAGAASTERTATFGAQAASSNPPPSGPTGGAYANAGAAGAMPITYSGSRTWAVLGHLAYLVPLPPHIAGLVITLVIWVARRQRDPFVEDQGRESLNFQLTYLGINALLGVTCVASVFTPVVWIAGAVLSIVAAVNTGDGKRYRYPLIFRLIA